MNAFSLLYFKSLPAKLFPLVLGVVFAASHCQFIRIFSGFIFDKCLAIVNSSWPRSQGVRLQISRSQVRSQLPAKFTNSRLISVCFYYFTS